MRGGNMGSKKKRFHTRHMRGFSFCLRNIFFRRRPHAQMKSCVIILLHLLQSANLVFGVSLPNPTYKQLGSEIASSTKDHAASFREYGKAVVLKRLPTNSNKTEISFKVASTDTNIMIVFSSDNSYLEYSVRMPNGQSFESLNVMESSGAIVHIRGNDAAGLAGRYQNLATQKIEFQNKTDGHVGSLTVKADMMAPALKKTPSPGHLRRSLSETTAVAIFSSDSNWTACLEYGTGPVYVDETAQLEVGICDKNSGQYISDIKLISGTVQFTASGDQNTIQAVEVNATNGLGYTTFTPTLNSTFTIQVDLMAATIDGEELERQLTTLIRVLNREIDGISGVSLSLVEDNDNNGFTELLLAIHVQLATNFVPSSGKRYIVQADVYDAHGAAIMAASGMTDLDVQESTLTLIIQMDWFDERPGPYAIRYVRITDAEGLVPLIVSQREFMIDSPTVADSIPPNRRLVDETEGERQRRMRMGRRPLSPHIMAASYSAGHNNRLRERRLKSSSSARPNSSGRPNSSSAKPNSTAKSNSTATKHALVLVHGYCISPGHYPWDPNDFLPNLTNAVKFADYNQGISNYEFALEIANFTTANGIDKCSIVAHSQGGMAALHLATFFWSCLDYTDQGVGGTRSIQTVGTPYQGTALAGNLATLATVFGMACGTVYDETYRGAAVWLSLIPQQFRSWVYYYTTSASDVWWQVDYCDLASDLVLSRPNDGVTELWSGQLPGGNNEGNTVGECHTAFMKDPGQYLDKSRNLLMAQNSIY